uniref:Uncharacterized protein n=1 Tax=Glossina morsitans morsitans TaxID=37546 RepID=A0A1B0FQJ8_GLOMM
MVQVKYTRDRHTPYIACMYQSYVKEKLFNTEFNLKFRTALKEICRKCDLLKGAVEACMNEEKELYLRQSQDLRLQNAERARNCLAEEQKKAKGESQRISWILIYFCKKHSRTQNSLFR